MGRTPCPLTITGNQAAQLIYPAPCHVIVTAVKEAVSVAADVKKRVDQLKKDGKNSGLLLVANSDREFRFVALSVQKGGRLVSLLVLWHQTVHFFRPSTMRLKLLTSPTNTPRSPLSVVNTVKGSGAMNSSFRRCQE